MEELGLRGVRPVDAEGDRRHDGRAGPSLPHRAGAKPGIGRGTGRSTRGQGSLRTTPTLPARWDATTADHWRGQPGAGRCGDLTDSSPVTVIAQMIEGPGPREWGRRSGGSRAKAPHPHRVGYGAHRYRRPRPGRDTG